MDEGSPGAAGCAGGRARSPYGQGTPQEGRRKFVSAICGVSEAELKFVCLDVFACNAIDSWLCIFVIPKICIFKHTYH